MDEEKSESEEKKVSWLKKKPGDVEKLIVEIAKTEKSPAKIGLILRDKHGVPKAKALGKKITHILKEKGIEYEHEGKTVERRVEKLKTHIGKNKHDYPASRALSKKLWVLNK